MSEPEYLTIPWFLRRDPEKARQELMCENCIRICNAIGELNNEEGNGVNILAANPDFIGANYAIETTAEWTNWQPTRFEGETMPEALENAVTAKRANS